MSAGFGSSWYLICLLTCCVWGLGCLDWIGLDVNVTYSVREWSESRRRALLPAGPENRRGVLFDSYLRFGWNICWGVVWGPALLRRGVVGEVGDAVLRQPRFVYMHVTHHHP